jgi:hypothetical protein
LSKKRGPLQQYADKSIEISRIKDKADDDKGLGIKECPKAKDRLVAEVFPPDLNSYQWFVSPRSGRILLYGLDNIAFLTADIKGWNKLGVPSIHFPASIVFTVATVLPPLFIYFLLIGGVGLVGWIARGFTN